MRYRRILPFIFSIAICVASYIGFVQITGNLYSVGGDDTRLYYLFPKEMLQNFIFKIITENSLGVLKGYQTNAVLFPITFLSYCIKQILPTLHTQAFMYGVNISAGFIFMYLFIGYWINRGNKSNTLIRISASFFYILSVYLIRTLYSHQLLSIYLVGVFPAVLYYLCRSVFENRIIYAVIASVIYSLFSSTFMTLPWFAAAIISVLPMILYLFIEYPRSFLKTVCVFCITTLFLNAYWLIHFIYPIIKNSSSGLVQLVNSQNLKTANIDLIQALVYLNQPIHQISSYIRSNWLDRQGMSGALSMGLLYFFIITIAGFFVQKTKGFKRVYAVSLGCLLWTMLFVTPNFGNWNISFFIFLNNTIPGFTMFRNMFDKFPLGMAFSYSFALASALGILATNIKRKQITILLPTLLLFITVYRAYVLVSPKKEQTNFYTTFSGQWNNDFVHLTQYINNMDTLGKFLWFPLNTPSYVVAEDGNNPGHYYYGSSPLRFLTGKSDLTGFQSFATGFDSDMNFRLLDMLKRGQYAEMAEYFGNIGVQYIIESKEFVPVAGSKHLNENAEKTLQNDDYRKVLFGKKIADFGIRYSIYELNPTYKKPIISFVLADHQNEIIPDQVNKNNEYEYSFSINPSKIPKNVIFREAYSPFWDLYRKANSGYVAANGKHDSYKHYGNIWELDLKRSPNDTEVITLLFGPHRLGIYGTVISIVTFIVTLGIVTTDFLRNRNKV